MLAGMSDKLLRPLLFVTGAYHALLGIVMWTSPGTFYDDVAPYPPRNDHFIGDLATYALATGAALLVAARAPTWRVPVLGLTALQYVLHVFNHVLDVDDSDKGVSNLVALAIIGIVLVWMLWAASRQAGVGGGRP
jgi:hypothetical protein